MATAVTYYEPYIRPSRVTPPPAVQPWVSAHPNGRFRFNNAAIELLGLRKNLRVMLGHQQEDRREWFVKVVREGGWLLRDMASGQTTRTCPPALGFSSLALLEQLQATLPHAPTKEHLRFKFEGVTELHTDGSEAWPLLTAPYWQRQEVVKASARPASFAIRGLLGLTEDVERYESPTDLLPMPVEAEAAPVREQRAAPPFLLAEQALLAAGYTLRSFAEVSQYSYQGVYQALRGRTALTPAFTLALENAGIGPAAYWLHAQADWQLAQLRQGAKSINSRSGRPRVQVNVC